MLLVRRARYALVAVVVLATLWLLYQARGALAPFLVGGVLAYVLSPLVERMARVLPFYRSRQELARTIAVLEVYLVGIAVLVTAGVLIIPVLVAEATDLVDNIPQYVERARDQFDKWNRLYQEKVPPEAQSWVEDQIRRLGQELGAIGRQALNRTFTIVTGTFSVVLGYIIIPFWLFYVLKDRPKIGPAIQAWFPPGLRADVGQCIEIVRRVVGSYVRAQLILGLFIGTVTTLGLWALGIDFYLILGIIAGITELIPIIGPILGAIPAVIVTLALQPEKTWLVILFYFLVQQVENAVLVPRIHGNAVNLHPAVIIVLLAVAQQIAGFVGMLVAVPLAAVGRDLFVYVYRRLQEQEELLRRRAAAGEASSIPAAGLRLPGDHPLPQGDTGDAPREGPAEPAAPRGRERGQG
jgi:predicted PurR-regulated permease PerM